MITNELLNIKYATQKKQDQEARHDLKRYVEITHRNIQNIAASYGLKLKYGIPTGTKDTRVESAEMQTD